jgi:tetratricopeptide (TPR) repeat protein
MSTHTPGPEVRHSIALAHQQRGEPAEAEAQWRAALAERPDFVPALLGLGELYLAKRCWDETDRILGRLEMSLPRDELAQAVQRLGEGLYGVEAAVLRARGCMACQEFTAARRILEEVICQVPQALWPRLLLSRVLLREGQDPAAAEKALRDILVLDPSHAEAQRGLALLLGGSRPGSGEASNLSESLAQLYHLSCRTPSDVHEHLPTLYALAGECRHVTEMGTRKGVSTTALLFARPDRLVCYDLVRCPQVDLLERLAGSTQFVFHQADVLRVEIEETDLLFLDTWHVYEQLREELRLHAGKVRRYIVLHDTATFRDHGETEGHAGLWRAVEEFLARGTFRLKEHYPNNNGLTVLQPAPPSRGMGAGPECRLMAGSRTP